MVVHDAWHPTGGSSTGHYPAIIARSTYLGFPHSSSSLSRDMKVVVTRILPPETQALLEAQHFDLVQWQQDCVMPREELLKQVKGKTNDQCIS